MSAVLVAFHSDLEVILGDVRVSFLALPRLLPWRRPKAEPCQIDGAAPVVNGGTPAWGGKPGESSPLTMIRIPNLCIFLCMLLFLRRMLHQYARYGVRNVYERINNHISIEDTLHGIVWDPRRVTCYVIKRSS